MVDRGTEVEVTEVGIDMEGIEAADMEGIEVEIDMVTVVDIETEVGMEGIEVVGMAIVVVGMAIEVVGMVIVVAMAIVVGIDMVTVVGMVTGMVDTKIGRVDMTTRAERMLLTPGSGKVLHLEVTAADQKTTVPGIVTCHQEPTPWITGGAEEVVAVTTQGARHLLIANPGRTRWTAGKAEEAEGRRCLIEVVTQDPQRERDQGST